MIEVFARTELIWQIRTGASGRSRRDYLDFAINGQSLHQIIHPGDNIGCFGWLPPESEQFIQDCLLVKRHSELGNNRYPIYICPECGDIGCGSITVEVVETGNGFIWKKFGYENNYDIEMSDFEKWESIGPFYFEKSDYIRVISNRPKRN